MLRISFQYTMRIATVLFFLLGIAFAQEEPETSNGTCACGWSQRSTGARQRIVGGTDATLGEFTMMAGLSPDILPDNVFCGATIITKKHILTASHCEPPEGIEISVVLGRNNLKVEEDGGVRIPVVKFIKHPQFNSTGSSDNDVAVLLLAKEIPFGQTIGPACFPGPGLNLVGEKVRIIGWGVMAHRSETQPNILQKIFTDVVPNKKCAKMYRRITPSVICTYIKDKDGCQGDSGGPVIHMNTTTMTYSIVGIVSRGIGCAAPDTPAVQTNVSYFRDWILEKIAETAPEAAVCSP